MRNFMIAVLCVFFLVGTAHAKITDLEVEFTIDAEFEPYITGYKLYTGEPGSEVKELVAQLGTTVDRSWVITALDLPAGQITHFYLSALYEGDLEDMSDAFPFKYTGKPVLIRISKR